MGGNKRILVLAGGAYISGAELVTLDVIRFLKEESYNVHCVVNGWNDGTFISALDEIGVPYTVQKLGWYYTSKLAWTLGSLVNYPGAVKIFYQLLRKFKPDIIYTTSYRPVFLLYPFLKAKIIYHAHDPNGETKQGRFFIRLIDKKISRYIAVSNFIKQDLTTCGVAPDKIEVIYNGVSISNEKHATQQNKMPGGVLRIGIAGQVIPRKGHEDLLDALSTLIGIVPFECLIFGKGQGSFESALIEKVKLLNLQEQVRWMGFVTNKNEIYPLIDVLVVPTRNDEPFGLVAAEAGCFNVCSIVTNSGGLTEIINDEKTGFIVPKKTPAAITEKLLFMYRNPDVLTSMGKLARTNVEEKFTLSVMLEKVGRVFRFT